MLAVQVDISFQNRLSMNKNNRLPPMRLRIPFNNATEIPGPAFRGELVGTPPNAAGWVFAVEMLQTLKMPRMRMTMGWKVKNVEKEVVLVAWRM